ncbi:unnamed protein product [Vicia faba]|uniref:Uncharacterized protein n=1 Tax=Vicia faba TaxID=3906 RepID=A0AAV1ABW3_VICFA|nr:unnamed protein product [Vicia faba]
MPTLNQLIRHGREEKRRTDRTRASDQCPQKQGVRPRVSTRTPKKPNSAPRVFYPGRSGNYHFVSTGPVLSGPSISQFLPLVSGKGSPALIMLGRPLLMYLSLMEARGNEFHRQAFLAVKAAPPESRMDPFARSAGSPPYRVSSVRREERCWRRGTRICPFYTSTKCPPPGPDHVHNQRLPSMVSGASLPNYQTWQQRLHAVLVVLLSSLLGTDKPHRDVLEHSLYVIFKRVSWKNHFTFLCSELLESVKKASHSRVERNRIEYDRTCSFDLERLSALTTQLLLNLRKEMPVISSAKPERVRSPDEMRQCPNQSRRKVNDLAQGSSS